MAEFCPNYLFHLLALARTGFESDYADRYASTAKPADIEFIRKNERLFAIGVSDGGQLTALIAFPVYFGISTQSDFEEFFNLFNSGLEENDFTPFMNRYRSSIDRLNVWITVDEQGLLSMNKYCKTINVFGSIVLGNLDRYRSEVWPVEKPSLEAKADEINRFFGSRDVIGQWEKLLGLEFRFDIYNIILCSAIKNGPNANSLAYDAVVFYHDDPFDKTIQFISHEVGTHLLSEIYKKTAIFDVFEQALLYRAYENLAKFYNRKVLKLQSTAYHLPDRFKEERILAIYEKLFEENPEISPQGLLIRGMEKLAGGV